MLASISPLGERARGNRWGLTAGAFLAASTVAGGVTGLVAGAVGEAVVGRGLLHAGGGSRAGVFIALAVLAAAVDAGLVRVRLRPSRRQVNERWLGRYRGWVYGVGFGAQLGTGVVTIVTTATIYLALAAAALSASWAAGTVIGLVFGTARAAPVLLTAPIRTAGALRTLHATLDRWRRPTRWLVVVASLGAGVLTLGGRW